MIRKPVKEDTCRTAEIHVYGWRTAYKGLIPNDFLYNIMRVDNSIKSHINLIENSPEIFDIYEDDNDRLVKGFILHGEPRDCKLENVHELYAIYIEPNFKREGIGYELLKHVEKVAMDRCKEGVILWVLENNLSARKFYEKNGFEFDGNIKSVDEWNQSEFRYIKRLK